MAQQQHRFPQNSDHVSAFVAAPVLPQPAPPIAESGSRLVAALRSAAQAFGQRFKRAEPARPPEFTTVYAHLRHDLNKPSFTADSTVAHLQNGTADSQIPQQEHLLKYLRSNRQLRITASTVGQERVLQIDIPRWEDAAAIRKRLTIYHPGAIAALHDAPTVQVTAARPGTHSKPAAQPAARM
jgi:hypothetical protein